MRTAAEESGPPRTITSHPLLLHSETDHCLVSTVQISCRSWKSHGRGNRGSRAGHTAGARVSHEGEEWQTGSTCPEWPFCVCLHTNRRRPAGRRRQPWSHQDCGRRSRVGRGPHEPILWRTTSTRSLTMTAETRHAQWHRAGGSGRQGRDFARPEQDHEPRVEMQPLVRSISLDVTTWTRMTSVAMLALLSLRDGTWDELNKFDM